MLHHAKRALYFTGKSLIFAIFFFILFVILFTVYIQKRSYDVGNRMYPTVVIDGVSVQYQTKQQVKEQLERKQDALRKIVIQVHYDEKQATFSAKTLNIGLDIDTTIQKAYAIGRHPNKKNQGYEKVRAFLGLGTFNFKTPLRVDMSPIKQHMAILHTSYDREPENALFTMENGRVSAFRVERNGIQINSEQALNTISKEIERVAQDPQAIQNIHIAVSETITKPEITLSSANTFGIEEKIGEATSNYAGSIPGRIHNVILGTSKFNGIIIPKGEVFSFVRTVGDISAATGYAPAYIIKDGKTILGDGGGICQVSTTLFRAALDTGLPIIERHAHAYRVHYYENDRKPGFDATVFSPSVDLKIKNDTDAAILIQTSVDKTNQVVTFTMYGKRDNRTVELSDAKIWDVVPAPEPKFQEDPTMKRGTQKQVDWAAPGTKSTFHYKVTKDDAIIQDVNFYSNYRPWQAVFLVGTGN